MAAVPLAVDLIAMGEPSPARFAAIVEDEGRVLEAACEESERDSSTSSE